MKTFKKLIVIAMFTILMLCNTLTAFALSRTEIEDYLKTYGVGKINGYYELSQTDPNNIEFTLPSGATAYLKPEGVKAIQNHLDSINKSKQDNQAIQGQISGLDSNLGEITPDMEWAAVTLRPFIPAVRYILGIMVTVITLGMTLLCAADISYILFPVFRGKCEDMKQKGGALVDKNRSNKSGQTRLKFISDEAEYAINAAETVQTGKNPLVIYFGKRALSYIVLAIVLFILLTGNITIITDIAIKAASGILELIQNMGNA